jgi:UDP-N-acetylglucosamine:LPS N-acetylglucosamine transferase
MSTSLSVVPRRAVIVSAGNEGGQAELALALEGPLQAEFGAPPLRIDVNDYLTPAGRSSISETFRSVFAAMPKLFGADRNKEMERAIQEVRNNLNIEALTAALGGAGHPNGPAAALCLHPVAAAAVGELRRRGKALYPTWAIVGDYYVNPFWIDSGIDRYAVAHEDIKESLVVAGVDPKQVVVAGIPVRELVPEKSVKEAREMLRLEPDVPVLLMLAKGQDEEILDRVLFQCSIVSRPVQFLFGYGSDKRAQEFLRQRAPRYNVRAKMFGEATTLGPILDASDALIAPARGSLIARTLSRGIVLFSVNPSAQETQNLDFLSRYSAAVRVDNVLQLAAEIELWLTRGVNETKAKFEALKRPNAPLDIAQAAIGTSREIDRILAESRAREEQRNTPVRNIDGEVTTGAKAPSAPGFFEEIGGPVNNYAPPAGGTSSGAPRIFTNSGKPSRDALAAIIYAERQAQIREDEAKANTAKWERRREMAIRRGEAHLAADAARQADTARAEMSRARTEREEAARQRAAITNQMVGPAEQVQRQEVQTQSEEKSWRRMELEEELDALKKRMQPPDPKKTPSR